MIDHEQDYLKNVLGHLDLIQAFELHYSVLKHEVLLTEVLKSVKGSRYVTLRGFERVAVSAR